MDLSRGRWLRLPVRTKSSGAHPSCRHFLQNLDTSYFAESACSICLGLSASNMVYPFLSWGIASSLRRSTRVCHSLSPSSPVSWCICLSRLSQFRFVCPSPLRVYCLRCALFGCRAVPHTLVVMSSFALSLHIFGLSCLSFPLHGQLGKGSNAVLVLEYVPSDLAQVTLLYLVSVMLPLSFPVRSCDSRTQKQRPMILVTSSLLVGHSLHRTLSFLHGSPVLSIFPPSCMIVAEAIKFVRYNHSLFVVEGYRNCTASGYTLAKSSVFHT